MTYRVEFSSIAVKQLGKLPKEVQQRIIISLKRVRIRPFAHVLRLVGSPLFRLRVGPYRLILDIRAEQLLVLVLTLGHRDTIYKR